MPAVLISVERFGERVMRWHRMVLATFLVQADGPPGTARPQILDFDLQGPRVMRANE
jgi:hypothetical protein